jgi:hypothetical protein
LDTLDPPTLHLLQRYVKQCAPRKRKKPTPANQDMSSKVSHLPSPSLHDMHMDLGVLEDDAFGIDMVDTNKRGRASFDPILSYDSYLPDGLESDSEDA